MIRLRTEDLAWHEVEGEIICLDIARSRYLGINPAGVALWPLLLEGTTLDDLTSCLVDAFSISAARAASDVETFLNNLRQRSLLEI